MSDLQIYRRNLPHWRIDTATYFVTWRLFPGACLLQASERTAVAQAIVHFDGSRYALHAYVVMDDHVHVIVRPSACMPLEQIVHSWKSFSANRLQREHGRRGVVWQRESFDRIVRDENEWLEKIQYIINNPMKRWPALKEYPWVWPRWQ